MIQQDYWSCYQLMIMCDVLGGKDVHDSLQLYTKFHLTLDELEHIFDMVVESVRGLQVSDHDAYSSISNYSAVCNMKYWTGEKPVHASRISIMPRPITFDSTVYLCSLILTKEGLHLVTNGWVEVDLTDPNCQIDDSVGKYYKIGTLKEVKKYIRKRRKSKGVAV